MFESGVISYGNQTVTIWDKTTTSFESGVISYGNQTEATAANAFMGLRVV